MHKKIKLILPATAAPPPASSEEQNKAKEGDANVPAQAENPVLSE